MKLTYGLFALALLAGASSCDNGTADSDTTDSASADVDSSSSGSTVQLINGSTLTGWHSYGMNTPGSNWSVDSGAIHLDPKGGEGGGGDLVTNDEYGNFDLQLDWKIAKNGNSGIIFYVHEDTAHFPYTFSSGPEMQVLDNEGHPDAKIIKHRAGDLYDLITSSPETVKPAGEWNHAEIKSDNGKLDFYLNGEHTLSTTMWDDNWNKMVAGSKFKNMTGFGTYKTGHIALQNHGDEVWFKNITIQKL